MNLRTICCDSVIIGEPERRKFGWVGWCDMCRCVELLYEITEPEQSPTDLKEERDARMGDYLRDKEV